MSHGPYTCRGCDSTDYAVLLDMGKLPLANAFVGDNASTEDRFTESLTLVMCKACSLIQIMEEVPREKLFGQYLWVTSTSETVKKYAQWFSQRLRERHHHKEKSFLVEIASNDGFFLRHYRDAGFGILGVDPSNLAVEANAQGLPSIRDFFGVAVVERVLKEHGPADVMVARNVLGHSCELQDLVAGIQKLLAPDGVLVLEVPYAFMLRNELQYDTVFHEHLSYLTVGSVSNLMRRFGMKITDITFVNMNGGSLLCEIKHERSPTPRADQAFIDFESMIQLNTPEGWQPFAEAVKHQREAFVGLLEKLAKQGKRVVGYGAAAKCMTMLNYCGVGTDLMSAVGDANPRKQGLLCPGVRIPVVSPEDLMAMDPDYIVIGAWNFKDEIIFLFKSKHGYRNSFIVPLPTPVIIP